MAFQKIGYNTEINYLGAYASGLICSDILKLGENTINNLTFLLINEINFDWKISIDNMIINHRSYVFLKI